MRSQSLSPLYFLISLIIIGSIVHWAQGSAPHLIRKHFRVPATHRRIHPAPVAALGLVTTIHLAVAIGAIEIVHAIVVPGLALLILY